MWAAGTLSLWNRPACLIFCEQKAMYFMISTARGFSQRRNEGIYLQNFGADTFITGTNAITQDGKLFHIDGNGSRVAPMLYGPEQVIVVVGKNKITETVEEKCRFSLACLCLSY